MRKIKNVEDALLLFESNGLIKDECNKTGNYRKGNTAQKNIRKIVKYLLENNSIDKLKVFYTSNNEYVRLGAAAYLAPIDNEVCYNIIKEIKDGNYGWTSFSAENILDGWERFSNINFYNQMLSEE